MAQTFVVEEGDSIDKIAAEFGHFPATLWEAEENAALRELRENPNVLLPGDEVFVPDLRPKSVPAATGLRHVFRRRGVPSKFRLQLFDEDGPRANLPYRIALGTQVVDADTDAEGRIEHWLGADVTEVVLTIAEERYTLFVGHLDPITEDSGIDARLFSLGDLGTAKNVTPEDRAAALRAFQQRAAIEVTGEANDETRAALIAQYGC